MTDMLYARSSHPYRLTLVATANAADDRPDGQRRCSRIVVLLDGTGLAERAIPTAAELARMNEAELILVHVYQSQGIKRIHDVLLPTDAARVVKQAEAEASRYLQSQCSKLRRQKLNARGYILKRESINTIRDVAETEQPDLLVMVQPQRHWLVNLFHGDPVSAIRERAGVPVLAVKV